MAKFKTLTHNGVTFPAEYEVKGFKVAGEKLSPLAEEMLWNYAQKRDTDYPKSKTYRKNFYSCLKDELTPAQQAYEFPKDFMSLINNMFDKIQVLKEEAAQYRKDNKEKIKAEKEAMKEKYGYAMLDGQRQPLGAYQIEPPGIMIARGDSKVLGLWKYRTQPEDVIINFVGPKADVPKAPDGHRWKEVECNTNAFVIAKYEVNLGNIVKTRKKVMFGANSSVKTNADQKKFDKAIVLLKNWDKMQKHIVNGMKGKTQEVALISYLVQTTGIRIGSQDLDGTAWENGVVGASTLKGKNLSINGNVVTLDFLGKDSVPFKQDFEVIPEAANALQNILKNAKPEEKIFTVTAGEVAKFLGSCVPGVTPKLMRTAWGTKLLVDALKAQNITPSMTLAQKLHAYDMANLEVAKKLNHRKNISKNFDDQMEKMDSKLAEAVAKETELEAKAKKELKEIIKQIKMAKSTWEGEKLEKALDRLETKKAKIQARVERAKERIVTLTLKKDIKRKTADIALGTSRSAYSSPMIAFSFCKDNDIPVEKIYSKSLKEKFSWAEKATKSYWKKYPNV